MEKGLGMVDGLSCKSALESREGERSEEISKRLQLMGLPRRPKNLLAMTYSVTFCKIINPGSFFQPILVTQPGYYLEMLYIVCDQNSIITQCM